MDIVQIAVTGIIGAILAISIKKHSSEFAVIISLATCVLIFIMIMPMLADTIAVLRNLSEMVSSFSAYTGTLLKIIFIAYIAEFSSQICIDAGESAIASKIELGGKILIMVASAPIMMGLISLVNGILP